MPTWLRAGFRRVPSLAGTATGPGPGPDRASGEGGADRPDYWYEDEWTAWHEAHLRGEVGSLTRVDRGGDPDDLVDAAGAARMMGYSGRDVIHGNRRMGYFPEPDAYGKARRGRPVPRWKHSTVRAAADRRQGMGGRASSRRSALWGSLLRSLVFARISGYRERYFFAGVSAETFCMMLKR